MLDSENIVPLRAVEPDLSETDRCEIVLCEMLDGIRSGKIHPNRLTIVWCEPLPEQPDLALYHVATPSFMADCETIGLLSVGHQQVIRKALP